MHRALIAATLALAGCSKTDPTPVPAPSAAIPVASVSAGTGVPALAASALPSAPVETHSVSFATFRGDALDECVDMTVRGGPAPAEWSKPPPGATKLSRPCIKQFEARTPLAACTVDADGGTMVAFRYDARGVDGALRECTEMGGRWEEDRRAQNRARLEAAGKALQNLPSSSPRKKEDPNAATLKALGRDDADEP